MISRTVPKRVLCVTTAMTRNRIPAQSRAALSAHPFRPMNRKRNSSSGLLLLREQGRRRLMAAVADDRFGEIRQCVAALHSAGLGDSEDAGRGHLPLGTAIAKDDFAQLHGNA